MASCDFPEQGKDKIWFVLLVVTELPVWKGYIVRSFDLFSVKPLSHALGVLIFTFVCFLIKS